MYLEQNVDISCITGEQGATGCADAIILLPGHLEVYDFKHGKMPVEARENLQLLMYAYQYSRKYPDLAEVHLGIIQPRVFSEPRIWTLTVKELEERCHEISRKSIRPIQLLSGSTVNDDDDYPIEDICRWCVGKARCPALSKVVYSKALDKEEISIPDAMDMDIEELKTCLHRTVDVNLLVKEYECIPIINIWTESRKELMQQLLEKGELVPGYTLGKGRKMRTWKTDAPGIDELYENTLISPSQAEHKFRKNTRLWEKISELIYVTEGKPTVTKITCPKDELNI